VPGRAHAASPHGRVLRDKQEAGQQFLAPVAGQCVLDEGQELLVRRRSGGIGCVLERVGCSLAAAGRQLLVDVPDPGFEERGEPGRSGCHVGTRQAHARAPERDDNPDRQVSATFLLHGGHSCLRSPTA
jgi:hypothetical protein